MNITTYPPKNKQTKNLRYTSKDLSINKTVSISAWIVLIVLSANENNILSLSVAKTSTFSGCNFDSQRCPKAL